MGCFCKRTRTLHCKVVLLDEQELVQEIQENSPGHEVLDTVFRHLNLLETAYFGLRYLDTANQPHWLDPTKKVARELKGTVSCTLYFGVKFYAADPCKLLEEITRYQFYLQVKQDILQGRLPVNFDLASELGAYVVQSELGDYDSRRHSPGYVSEFRFVSNQSAELENRIAELHKSLVGKLPADAELAYLDRVKWLDMYGVDLHPVLGEDNVEYFLGLTPSGIIVLRNKNKVGNYYWPRITKIYFKGRYFMLRVCDKNSEESTYGFETPSRAACKQLWKCCVEHHAFFRLVCVSPPPNDIFRLSSRFRYSGRTEKQARSDVEAGRRAPPAFERSPSRRQQRRVVEGSAGGPGPTPAPAPAPSKWQGRRVVEGAPHTPSVEEIENRENVPPSDKDKVTSNVGRQPGPPSPPLSTRSTRSAPWAEPHARGLYSGSPRSARSACSTGTARAASANQRHRRSSSVESHSSNDSRPCRRHRRHRSRKGSDSESEVSKCSERCHSRCRHRHRRHRSRHKSSNSGSRVELVDSTGQWREVQRRQADGAGVSAAGRGSRVQQAVVVSSRRSGYAPDAEAGAREPQHGRHKRRVRSKHRSRSQSPSESKRLPDELKQHLDFDLVDTEGMSEAQLREIPYTVIQTNAKAVKVKMSPSNRRRAHRTSRRSLKSLEDGGSTDRLSVNSQPASLASRSALRVPPLPGSPSASSLLERPDRPASARGSGSASLASASQSAVPGPLPRPSGAQLNGSANLPPQHGGPDGLHEAHLPKYIKSLKTIQPSQYGSRSQAAPSFSSSDRLDASDGLGVTSFMSSGANANRARGASSPHGYRPGVWCEVKPSGGYAASAALSAPSLAASVNGGLQHGLRGGGGGRRAGGSPSSPLPPVVTPYGVTFPHLSGQHGLHGQPRGRAAQPSLGQQAGQAGRAGPLFFQQQRQQQQQHQHQQTHTPVVGNALYNDCASVKALKTSERVQNAAYISLQCSDPLLNGNGPVHQKQCSTESCTEL